MIKINGARGLQKGKNILPFQRLCSRDDKVSRKVLSQNFPGICSDKSEIDCLGWQCCIYMIALYIYINGWVQERHNSIANTLELRLSCTHPLIWCLWLCICFGSLSISKTWYLAVYDNSLSILIMFIVHQGIDMHMYIQVKLVNSYKCTLWPLSYMMTCVFWVNCLPSI